MKFMLMLLADEKAGATISPQDMAGFMGQLTAYQAALTKAGAFVATAALQPTDTARTVTTSGGELKVQDGPYADTREQFGGYFIISAPDMDEAVRLAAQCPAASWGHIEVRPFHDAYSPS